jgi:hypothetical protein
LTYQVLLHYHGIHAEEKEKGTGYFYFNRPQNSLGVTISISLVFLQNQQILVSCDYKFNIAAQCSSYYWDIFLIPADGFLDLFGVNDLCLCPQVIIYPCISNKTRLYYNT